MEERDIEKRNLLLERFFEKIFPNKTKLITFDINNPSVIYNDEKKLSCYVHNFELRFNDAPDKGNVIYTIKLENENKTKFELDKILDWYKNYEHKHVYRIMMAESKPTVYLSGFNYLKRELAEGKYPVFSVHNPRVFFTREKAQEIASPFLKQGYNLLVV